MSVRSDFLERRLEAYLERRTLPRGFDGKPKLIDDETDALHRCVSRFAPKEHSEEWFNRFEEKLAEDAKTRAWPTEGEIKAAALAISPPPVPTGPLNGFEANPLEIAAKRMNAGRSVSETYVWGRNSDLLQQRGMVLRDVMDSYRFASIQSFISVYRHDAQAVAQNRLGPCVAPYFDRLATWKKSA